MHFFFIAEASVMFKNNDKKPTYHFQHLFHDAVLDPQTVARHSTISNNLK